MREISVALGLIKQGDNFLLQLRGDDPKIGAAGMIGCFGGKIEQNETPREAVCREIAEETTINQEQDAFNELGVVRVVSDNKLEQVNVAAHTFEILVDQTEVLAREGTLVIVPHDTVTHRLDQMTPGTKAVFETFILGEK